MGFIRNNFTGTTALLLLVEVFALTILLCVLAYLYYDYQINVVIMALPYAVIIPTASVVFFMILFGAYDPIARIDMHVFGVRHRAASVMGIFFAWLYAYLYVADWISPLYGIVMAGSTFLGVQIVRTFARNITSIAPLQDRLFLLGTNAFLETEQVSANVMGHMTLEAAQDKEEFLKKVFSHSINEIVVGGEMNYSDLPTEALLECKTQGIKITPYVDYFERKNKRVTLEHIYPQWFVFTSGFRYTSVDRFLKRTVDISFALTGLVIAFPLMLLIALLIKVTSPGPVLYQQIRIGLNGQPFNIKKFRSMTVDAEKEGAQWAKSNDTRITFVGRFIRKTRIDELPQLLNILNGEMSIVGPRPERPVFVEQLSEKIPYYRDRHRVKPGLTGWAQVNYPYGASEEDAWMKLTYDLYYMKHFSIALDMLIMFKTVRVVLFGDGAR